MKIITVFATVTIDAAVGDMVIDTDVSSNFLTITPPNAVSAM